MEETNTVMVKVKPDLDAEVTAIYTEALKAQEYATARVIATAEDLKPATDDLSIIAKVKKALEEKRREYLKPLQDHVKEINEVFKTLAYPIEEADRITRSKILAFQAEQDRIRREQEEINQMRMQAAEKEAALKNGEITESVNLVEVSPEAPKRVSTEMGTVGQRKIRKYRVINFAELPDQYKIENSALLNKVVKAGIPTIPGVEIYEEPILTVNAR